MEERPNLGDLIMFAYYVRHGSALWNSPFRQNRLKEVKMVACKLLFPSFREDMEYEVDKTLFASIFSYSDGYLKPSYKDDNFFFREDKMIIPKNIRKEYFIPCWVGKHEK